MTRDFNKDLMILVAGSANANMTHLEESLGDWIFPDPEFEREVTVIIPVLANMGGAVRNIIKIGTNWEFNFQVVQADNAPMTRELSALPEECFTRADDEREALELSLSLLAKAHKEGQETAFFHAYNPKNTYEQGSNILSDFEIIGDAKNYPWLTTLNICEGLIDSFEGYKSTDELLKEERLKKEFEEKKAAEEAAKPKPAKKASAPRKRAAKKAEPQEPKPLMEEPEKPLQDIPVGTTVEVGGLQFTKHSENPFADPRNELSASVPIVIGGPTDDMLNVSMDYVRENLPKPNTLTVSRDALAQLSADIRSLTDAFGNIMDTFTQILKEG